MTQLANQQIDYLKESNQVLSNKGKTFSWAKFLLTKKQANRAVRLYRFCRFIDDLGDEYTSIKSAKLALDKITEDLKSGASTDPIVADAIALFSECQIDVGVPVLFIEGVLSDLKRVRIKNEQELIVYCYQVAGTVGLMMSKILDVNDPRALAHAIDLGIAMQITNICRDVTEDAHLKRRYLPASLIGNVEPAQLLNPDLATQGQLRATLKSLLQLADQYYKSGYEGLCFITLRSRLSIAIASSLYRQIGLILKKEQYECWRFRSVASPSLKLKLSFKIVMTSLLDKDFFKYKNPHKQCLHLAIKKMPYVHA